MLIKYRARLQPIRTLALRPIKVKIPCQQNISLYQILSPKVKELKALGISYKNIALALNINLKTVLKALSHFTPH
ncbi:MAG: hypothetical protein S4CHLAM7_01240 [Chlamydiae bacterium]|nr:hypothetical protein [Chlamydiota bacterium]